MFSVRSIFEWFINLSSSKTNIRDDIQIDRSSSMSETWNGLPDVAIKKIFGKLKARDRTRMKSVSKSWNRMLNRVDIPTCHEAPWLIFSEDSCSSPQTFLTRIKFGTSLPGNQVESYHFDLPKFYNDVRGGCLCGTSNGWLVIAAGKDLKPDLFLWNPLSGTTRKLPPLPAFVPGLRPKLDELPSFIKRVEVFSQECVVAVVFSHPKGENEDCLALCTPQEERWSIMNDKYYDYSYNDILFHNGKLYALAQIINDDEDEDEDEEDEKKEKNYVIYLSSGSKYRKVEVCVLHLEYTLNAQTWTRYNEDKESNISPSFNITYADVVHEHLVGCSITGRLLVVTAIFNLFEYNSNDDGPVESFTCHQTHGFEVRVIESLARVGNIGEQTMFVASTGSFSVPSCAEGLLPDRISFATDDARGVVGDEEKRIIVARETGQFDMQQNIFTLGPVQYLRFPVQSKIGFFRPKLF